MLREIFTKKKKTEDTLEYAPSIECIVRQTLAICLMIKVFFLSDLFRIF